MLSNKAYLLQALSGLQLSEGDIDLILLKAGLEPSAEVDVSACDHATYNRMSILLRAGLQNISEGGYSISWNMEAVKLYYQALCRELGKPDYIFSSPKLRNRSELW